MSSKPTLLADYQPPVFMVDDVDMDVDIHAAFVSVTTRMTVKRNPASKQKKAPLFLNGINQKLVEVCVNDKALTAKDYTLTPEGLTIPGIGNKAVVEVTSTHDPYTNTTCTGFYKSGPILNTQCEAEGFRQITYYPDRPDVMAMFTVTLRADKKQYPTLLANGNLVAAGTEGKGRHFAIWEDPFRKPCYLFAMVAGTFDKLTSHYKTGSGRNVLIDIYVEPGKTNQLAIAMQSVKKAMKWDEETFGLEYDLDRFMIVGTAFFNAGAMENKGLNIFNDSCLLGTYETASDARLSFIERIIAHEYFHNWTGDRVTCRNWFQLSLKEGLTVYREQRFCGDMTSAAVERLDNIRFLRSIQFAEDAGAMAHPVRPDRYVNIRNFYTHTIYEKGAEVARMLEILVSRKGFRKGMDLYFKRHDGQAVTCDEFAKAMHDANGKSFDLKQFMLWYNQAGTPRLDVKSTYDAKKKTLTLDVKQTVPPTPGQKTKKPMLIPLAVGLLDNKGRDMLPTQVLQLNKARQSFTLKNIASEPTLSLLRNFSAPVILDYPYTDDQLLFLLAHDSDPFNKWDAGYKLATKSLLAMAKHGPAKVDVTPLLGALRTVLRDTRLDADFKTSLMAMPTVEELGLAQRAAGGLITLDELIDARRALMLKIADALKDDLNKVYAKHKGIKESAIDGKTAGLRLLKNTALSLLALDGDKKAQEQLLKQVVGSRNMTDQVAGMSGLASLPTAHRDKAFAAFEKRWKKSPNIMESWFALQAGARRTDALQIVQKLMKHPRFDIKNPNSTRVVLNVFANNPYGFHAKDGTGYRFIADMVMKTDSINREMSGSLAKTFLRWKDYDKARQQLMLKELKRIAAYKKLSASCREIIDQALKS